MNPANPLSTNLISDACDLNMHLTYQILPLTQFNLEPHPNALSSSIQINSDQSSTPRCYIFTSILVICELNINP